MRKIKKFVKKTIGLALCSVSLLVGGVAKADNITLFKDGYEALLQMMLQSYQAEVKEPLNGKLFDIRDPMVTGFVKIAGNLNRNDNFHFLSMLYKNNFKINNERTEFCMIMYDSNKILQLDRYMNATFPQKEDAIYYLVAHEMGHCAVAHQRSLKNIPSFNDMREEELYAEIFSVMFFLSRKQNDQALSVIKQNMILDKTAPHYNPNELKKAYIYYNMNNPEIKNIYDLYKVSYEAFSKINNQPNFLKDELDESNKSFENAFSYLNRIIFTGRVS